MSLSTTAEQFFLTCGITSAEIIDIKNIITNGKKQPLKDDVVRILQKIVVKANTVISKDGVWLLATESSKASDEPSPPSTPADAPANIAAKAAVGAKLDDEEEIVDLDITTTQTQTSGTQAGGESSGPPSEKECVHLRAGHCKHGRMGRTKDEEGKICQFLHPRKLCQSHLRTGRCQKKDCKNMHSFLCRNWKNGRECWTRDCKRLHPEQPAKREKTVDREMSTMAPVLPVISTINPKHQISNSRGEINGNKTLPQPKASSHKACKAKKYRLIF